MKKWPILASFSVGLFGPSEALASENRAYCTLSDPNTDPETTWTVHPTLGVPCTSSPTFAVHGPPALSLRSPLAARRSPLAARFSPRAARTVPRAQSLAHSPSRTVPRASLPLALLASLLTRALEPTTRPAFHPARAAASVSPSRQLFSSRVASSPPALARGSPSALAPSTTFDAPLARGAGSGERGALRAAPRGRGPGGRGALGVRGRERGS